MIRSIWQYITYNTGTKFISVLIAFVLWSIVLGSRPVEVEKEVPVQIITSENYGLVGPAPKYVRFRLSGPKAMLRSIVTRSEPPIRIDLTEMKEGVVHYKIFSDRIRVPLGVKVPAVSPAIIELKLEEMAQKSVPLEVTTRGRPEEGYRISSLELQKPAIQVRGPKSVLEKITKLQTIPVDVSGIYKTTPKEYQIDLQGLGIKVEEVLPALTVHVDAEVANHRIPNVAIRMVPQRRAWLANKTVTVYVRARQQLTLDSTKVVATVDLNGKTTGSYTLPIAVKLPPEVALVRIVPATTKVRIP